MSEFENYSSESSLQNDLLEEFNLDYGFDLGGREPAYDSLEVLRTDDKIIVGLLQYDQDAEDFFANDEGAGELIQFRNWQQRDSEMEKLSKTKKLFYLVDKFEHSQVHYSISGTHAPDRWDTAQGSAVFIPCDYIQSEYRKMKKAQGEGVAFQHFIQDSNNVLEQYSNWCNGEVYGYSVLTFDKKGNEIDCDECWGFIGQEYAQQEKQSIMRNIVVSDELNKLKENVIIETPDVKSINLPFRISKKDLEEVKIAHVYNTYIVGAKYAGEDNVTVYKWSEGDDKPTKAKFEEWQKKHGVSAMQFMTGRMDSDIKDVIRQHISPKEEKTNSMKM